MSFLDVSKVQKWKTYLSGMWCLQRNVHLKNAKHFLFWLHILPKLNNSVFSTVLCTEDILSLNQCIWIFLIEETETWGHCWSSSHRLWCRYWAEGKMRPKETWWRWRSRWADGSLFTISFCCSRHFGHLILFKEYLWFSALKSWLYILMHIKSIFLNV